MKRQPSQDFFECPECENIQGIKVGKDLVILNQMTSMENDKKMFVKITNVVHFTYYYCFI
jgi:hypothetical protein